MFLRCFASGIGGLFMTNCIHSKDVAIFRWRQSSDVLFGTLVDTSGRAEFDGIIDRSIPILVCTSRISIPEASTPNLLIVQDPFMSLLRTLIASVWEADVDSFQVLVSCSLGFWGRTILWFALKTSSSFVRNVLALFCFGPWWTPHDKLYSFERCNSLLSATIFWCFVWSIGGCLGTSWAWWHYRPIDRSRSWSVRAELAFLRRSFASWNAGSTGGKNKEEEGQGDDDEREEDEQPPPPTENTRKKHSRKKSKRGRKSR